MARKSTRSRPGLGITRPKPRARSKPRGRPCSPRTKGVAPYAFYPRRASGGVLGQLCRALAMAVGRGDDLHLLPVVGKLLAAIEARHIGSGQSCGLGAARCPANGNGKAVAGMPAAEKCVHQLCNHDSTFQTWVTALPSMRVPLRTVAPRLANTRMHLRT